MFPHLIGKFEAPAIYMCLICRDALREDVRAPEAWPAGGAGGGSLWGTFIVQVGGGSEV